tara:strand:- start:88 stop:1119 length:1032 start_codon:yes stop_codon:yes gene_type:complete
MIDDWGVSWSHQLDGKVGALCAMKSSVAVASGGEVRLVNDLGDFVWKRSFQFDVYRMVSDGTNLAVLSGPGFHLVDIASGKPLGEGRSVSGGFRDVIAQPGGGWVLSDRGDHIHIFNRDGRGVRRLRPGRLTKLLGWLDREHMLAIDHDGLLRCLRLFGQDSQRVIEERRWTWASRVSNGRLLIQSQDGSIMEGVPNPFGWDSLDLLVETGVDPLASARTSDGWWMLTMGGRLGRVPPVDGEEMPAGDHISSDDRATLVTATRDGLLRWWSSAKVISSADRLLQDIASSERSRIDWEQRQILFEAARDAEDQGLLTRAIELYGSLGRQEDVRRILSLKESGGR